VEWAFEFSGFIPAKNNFTGYATDPVPTVAQYHALYQFQIKDDIKAARTEATKAYRQYVEEPKTRQRR